MSNAFCQKCGAALSSGAAFCASCGQPVSARPIQYAPQPAPPYPQFGQQYYSPKRAAGKGKIIGIVSAVVVVVAAITVTLVLVLGGPSVKPEELSGTWNGTFKIERIDPNNDVGLDPKLAGTSEDDIVEISLGKNGKGTMVMGGTIECEAAFQGGRIKGEGSGDSGLKFYIEGSLGKSGDSYTFTGTWRFTYTKTNAVLQSGSWTAKLG
jgi:hypothetical protein